MKKLIDINQATLTKLKVISAFEDLSVKALMEKGVEWFVRQKELEQMNRLSKEEKEDLGLLLLLQKADQKDLVSEEAFFKALNK